MSNVVTSAEIPDRSWLPAVLPHFEVEQDRWATTRSLNVEKIAETWDKNPDLVRIFQDPKFGGMQMVLLRKDRLEDLIKFQRDVQNGQVAVRHQMQTLVDVLSIVREILEDQEQREHNLSQKLGGSLYKALTTCVRLSGEISSELFVKTPQKSVEPTPLSSEELEA